MMIRSLQRVALLSSIMGMLFLTGCGSSGPSLFPVSGVITVKGKPAENALVFMHREGRDAIQDPLPYGTCKADGSFTIETPMVGQGAQEGDYKITVYWPDMSKPEDGNGQRPDALNGAYEKVASSQLTATVKSGKNTLPKIDLVPGPPRSRSPGDQNLK